MIVELQSRDGHRGPTAIPLKHQTKALYPELLNVDNTFVMILLGCFFLTATPDQVAFVREILRQTSPHKVQPPIPACSSISTELLMAHVGATEAR